MRNVLLSAVASALVACSSGEIYQGGATDTTPQPESAGSTPSFNAQRLAVYLEVMQALMQGDTTQRTEIFRDVEHAANLAPTTINRLKLALALAIPGHPSSDPLAAQRLLSELLTARNALLPEERILAMIHLQEVEERRALHTEAQRFQQNANAEQTRQSTENMRELQVAQQENQRLREELDDALEKLETITSIEQSIREREDDADQP